MGIASVGPVVGLPQAAEPRVQKSEYFKWKIFDILLSQILYY